MIKIQNNVAMRGSLPDFLFGLAETSLADLSWTDPTLGVQDCAWWPEETVLPELGQYERYGDEVFTIDAENKRVLVTRPVVPFTQEEIDAAVAAETARKQARRDELTQQIAALQAELGALE